MHEVGIMEGALDMARRLMEKNGGTRLMRVHMTIGSLSGVVPEALQSDPGADGYFGNCELCLHNVPVFSDPYVGE